jgi:hypothetical protein
VLVQAALPYTAEKIRAQMQLTAGPVRLDDALFGNSLRGHTVGKPKVIFPPIEDKPPAGA